MTCSGTTPALVGDAKQTRSVELITFLDAEAFFVTRIDESRPLNSRGSSAFDATFLLMMLRVVTLNVHRLSPAVTYLEFFP